MTQVRLIFVGNPAKNLTKAFRKNISVFPEKMATWMRSTLIPAMVDGGLGIQGIAQTEFYHYITSDAGLSELGITREDPLKLLSAYRNKAFSVTKRSKTVSMKFGDVGQLKLATPHPAAGIGHLKVSSWLEFFVDKVKIKSGFVPRNNIPRQTRKAIRLSDPLGGLMLKRGVLGSTGKWQVPAEFFDYDKKWFEKNVGKINKLIVDQANLLLKEILK
jgi:hypothetical protein